ncbi:MAG TPA: nucleotidyltransferase family protein [Gemmatimonadaceae bacterium]|nr:nucleotidyltransferase family protein [Gemmatimonadaceae bacterium]
MLLRARRWALAVLAGNSRPQDLPAMSAGEWDLFLALERCGALLLSRLTNSLPSPAADRFRMAAATESQSSLQARAEGRALSGIASRLDFPVVVLKGGVRAISGASPPLPLVDLDLLVEKRHVETLTSELRKAGFGEPARDASHHRGIVPTEGRLAVDVHWTTNDDGRPMNPEVWRHIRAIDDWRIDDWKKDRSHSSTPPIPQSSNRLMRLSARDNLEHLLRHAIIVHRDRSVALRDIALIGYSVLDCNESDLGAVRAAIGSDRHAAKLASLLDLSVAFATGSAAVTDPFAREAAAFYASAVMESKITSPAARAFMMEIALERSTKREAVARALKFRGSGHESVERLAAKFPGAGAALAGAAHAAYYGAVAAVSLPRVRLIASRALRELDRQTH